MASLVAAKDKMFITQTKLLYEVTWKTVEQITKKHVVRDAQLLRSRDESLWLEPKCLSFIYKYKIYEESSVLDFYHSALSSHLRYCFSEIKREHNYER